MAKPSLTGWLKLTKDDREMFFKLSPDLFVVLGDRGEVVRVNPAFERSLLRAEADVLHHNIIVYICPKDIDVFLHAFVNPLPSMVFGLLRAVHGSIPVRLVAYCFSREDGQSRGYLIMQSAIVHESKHDWEWLANWSG
jgi:PAS domain-containing protein